MWLYRLNEILRPVARIVLRIRVFGGDAVPPDGPVILAANHASYLDPWLLGGFVPRGPVRFLMTDLWYDRSPVWNAAFRGWGTIPTATGRPDLTIERVVEALSEGAVVGVFPEGRISRNGAISRARAGIGFMAARSGAPVVPCGIRGSYRVLPRHRRLPRLSRVEIHIGEPLRFGDASSGAADGAAAQRFADEVVARIAALAGLPPRPSRPAR